MKIVLAHKYFYRGGGTATYLFALMEQLQARGHECVPFTVAYEQTVPQLHSQYYVSPPGARDQTHLRDMHSPLSLLKVLGRAIWSREAYHKALALSRDLSPDIAFVHNLYSYMSPSPIAAFKAAGLPVVMRVSDYNMLCPGLRVMKAGQPCTECVQRGFAHALPHRCHKGSLAATAARVTTMYAHHWLRVYDKVDLFLTPSEFLKGLMIEAGYRADKIRHLPSFYPVNPAAEPGRDRGYLLYFGRVAPEKGLDTLLDAMALLSRRPPLLIAGADVDGETARLQRLAWRNKLANVQFLGMQQREQLDRLIADARFVIVPSNWYDNCPMSVIESFAMGKPVLGANLGGIPEQITSDCGLLFRPGDPRDLALKIERLLDDPELREELGQGALRRMQTVYSPEAHCGRLLDLFTDLQQSRISVPMPRQAVGTT